jgi:hypothetical protein
VEYRGQLKRDEHFELLLHGLSKSANSEAHRPMGTDNPNPDTSHMCTCVPVAVGAPVGERLAKTLLQDVVKCKQTFIARELNAHNSE